MLIDWFTVIAQAVNFLVLMYLLKRFLYKPILNAIDAREEHIVETVEKAEDQKAAAKAEREIFVKKNEDFDRQCAELISQAREDAKATGERILEKERLAVNALREKWQSALADEQKRFGDETIHRIQEEVFAIVRQIFSDLADTPLEERMVEVFDRRLRLAWKTPDDSLAKALHAPPTMIRVKSAFDLSAAQQASLRQTLSETFAGSADIGFETEPNLIGGVELIADGQRVAWTVADYLARMKSGISYSPDSTPSSLTMKKMRAETPFA